MCKWNPYVSAEHLSGDEDDQKKFDLVVTRSSSPPQASVQGDEPESCGNAISSILSLAQNLSDFFKLHHCKTVEEDILLWIDAVGINQGDPAEVPDQIFQMDTIFESADEI